jgi:hypothetical protein
MLASFLVVRPFFTLTTEGERAVGCIRNGIALEQQPSEEEGDDGGDSDAE